jgi:hypothetical protein
MDISHLLYIIVEQLETVSMFDPSGLLNEGLNTR